MAEVTLDVGGRSYAVTCRGGEEEQLRRLATVVDAKVRQVRASIGGVNEARQLLLAALLLAEDLGDARAGLASVPTDPGQLQALKALTERVIRLAAHLESGARNA